VFTVIQRHINVPKQTRTRDRGTVFQGVLWVGGVILSAAVHAQSVTGTATNSGNNAAPASDTAPVSLEEIVVTARKREERVQDVPISLAILTSEALEKSGVTNLEDLGHEVPGLTVVSGGPGQNQITLRGLSGNNTVGLYVDDTPVSILNAQVAPNNWFMDPAMFDLQRVEVLKGPQGTLYGASSLGGTVRYITAQPDLNEMHATTKASVSDTDGAGPNDEVDGLINMPLIPGVLAVRAMAFQRYNDGYIDKYPSAPNNYLGVSPGPVDKDVNTENTYGGRVALKFRPVDAFTADLSATYQNIRLGAPFTFDEPQGSLDHPIQARLVNEASADRSWLYALALNADAGPVHITSSTSYFNRAYTTGEDDTKALAYFFPLPDGLAPASRVSSQAWNQNIVQEIRASGEVGPLHALLGVYYSHARAFGLINWPSVPAYDATFDNVVPFFGGNDYVDVSKAVFGEVNYDITRQLQLTVGAREFRQTQSIINDIQGVYAGGPETVTKGSAAAQGTTPKYGLTYHFTPDVMAYANLEKGFREGGPGFPVPPNCIDDYRAIGFPNAQAGQETSYKPDTIWNYEGGMKTSWADNRFVANIAGYYIKWANIQQIIILPCSDTFTGNFGSARSEGAEFDFHYSILPGLKADVSGAWNQAWLTQTVAGAQGVAGQTLEYAPKWTGSVTLEYDRPLGADTSGYVRSSVNVTSHEYTSFNTTSPWYVMPGYSLTNLRFGIKHRQWQSSLFFDNLFDKRAITDLYNAYGSNVPNTQPVGINRPLTIGVDLRYDW
jgi:outer membrane receptor protein involved in Fe transport